MHKNATKCNETLSKWCKNKHGASKIINTFGTYHGAAVGRASLWVLHRWLMLRRSAAKLLFVNCSSPTAFVARRSSLCPSPAFQERSGRGFSRVDAIRSKWSGKLEARVRHFFPRIGFGWTCVDRGRRGIGASDPPGDAQRYP
jgi:hypothetical protein